MLDRLIRLSDKASRRWTYPLIAFFLALGSPMGLLILRAGRARSWPGPSWLASEVAAHLEVYLYVTISTSIAFTLLGRIVGAMQETLRYLSITDPLTGLHNRRHFHARVLAEVARAQRYATPLSLLVIDIDGLKEVNDLHGHKAGDLALVAVARALAGTSRRTDVAARLGGDEFAILAPVTAAEAALALAERIRANLATSGKAPTVSIGIADLDGTAERSAEALYAAADGAVYDAKDSGRDRAVLARSGGASAAQSRMRGRPPFEALNRAPSGAWRVSMFRG